MPFLSTKDDYIYNNAAIEIMQRWKNSGWGFYKDLHFSTGYYSGFPNFSAALMMIFGKSHLVPRIGNAVISSLTCVLAYMIIRNYATKTMARFTGVILTTLPLTIIFSAMQLKDTLLLFFIVLALYASVSIILRKRILLSIAILIISYIGCSVTRAAVIVPLAVSLLFMILRSFLSFKPNANVIINILSLLIIGYILMYVKREFANFDIIDMDYYFESRYHSLTERSFEDSSANIRNMSIAQFLGAPLYLLFGLFLPPPLLVNIEDVINYSSWCMLAHFSFLPFLGVAMWNSIVKRKDHEIPFFLFLVYLFLRIGQANSLMTSFSPRQSLGTLFIMYMLLTMYDCEKKTWEKWFLFLSIGVTFMYNVVRLLSHGML